MNETSTLVQPTLLDILRHCPEHVTAPRYDRRSLKPGVFHIGPSNFFLAHLACILDDVAAAGDLNWGIKVASLRSIDTIDALRKQDGLYVLIESEGDERDAKIMAPIVECLYAPEDPAAIVEAMADPQIRMWTMTLTPPGYHSEDGELKLIANDVVHDLNLKSGDTPKTVFWYLTKALLKRRDLQAATTTPIKTGDFSVTIASFDNITKNSHTLRHLLIQYLRASGHEDLIEWMQQHVAFPVTLVDRITPKVTPKFREEARQYLGFESTVVIGSEMYRDLGIELSPFETPKWPDDVKVVDDCADLAAAKFFYLNAAHTVPAMVGARVGEEFIHDAMQRESLSALVSLFHEEIETFLPADASYKAKIKRRFADPAPQDTTRRVGRNGTDKASNRLMAAIERAMKVSGNAVPKAPTFVVACWLLNLGGKDEVGEVIYLDDPDAEKLEAEHLAVLAWSVSANPKTKDLADILRQIGGSTGDDRFVRMASVEPFIQQLRWSLLAITRQGAEEALKSLLG
jgi:mannitol-1-phosphate/altronate dehydrogenase